MSALNAGKHSLFEMGQVLQGEERLDDAGSAAAAGGTGWPRALVRP